MMLVRIAEEHDDDDVLCIERGGCWAPSSGVTKQLGVCVAHSASPQSSTSFLLHAHPRPVPTRRLFSRTSSRYHCAAALFLELPIQLFSLARIRGLKRAFSLIMHDSTGRGRPSASVDKGGTGSVGG